MQKSKCIFMALLIVTMASCVQKTSKKTVVVYLTVPGKKNIETVGLRGDGKPLSWDKDTPLTTIIKDSLYTGTFTVVTGYKFGEIKFTVNGEMEFNDKPNRRVEFVNTDTTIYKAIFNSN